MPRSDVDSDDEYYKKKKKKSKGKDHDRERDRSRSRERRRSRSRDRDRSKDRDKEKRRKEKKHKDKDKGERKSKSDKSDAPESVLSPAEKFNIFKKQRESGKKEDSVVDDMFKDFISKKLKEIENDTPDIPDNNKNSNNSSVEEMKKFLDTELNNISSPVTVKQEPKVEDTSKSTSEVTSKETKTAKTDLVEDIRESSPKDNGFDTKMQVSVKTEPLSDIQQAGFVPSVIPPKPIKKPTMVIGPMLPKTLAVKEENLDDTTLVKPEPPGSTDNKKGDNKKPMLGFRNFGIKLSITSTELIQSGAVHDKKGKRLEDGEVLSSTDSDGSNSSNSDPEPEVEEEEEDDKEISGTGSISDTDDESKSRKRKKKKKKGKHKKKKSKEKEKGEEMVVVVSDKPGEKRKVSLGSKSRSRSPKKSKHSSSDTKDRSKRSRSRDKSKRSRSKDRSKRSRSKDRSKRSKSREKSKRGASKDRSRRSRSRSKKRKSRSRSRGRRSSSRSKRRSKERSSKKGRSRSRSRDKRRSRSRSPVKSWRSSRYGDFDAYRFSSRKDRRSRSKTPDHREAERLKEKERKRLEDLRLKIDKAKLREIAMKNAVNAAQTSGLQLDVAIKSGGKSVAELTEYCKRIQDAEKAKKLARGEEVSSSDEEILPAADSDEDLPLHHPFKMKEPSAIVMDIQNAKQLALISPHERLAQTGQLRLQFPVSSGSQHRDKEWVPVEKPKPAQPMKIDLGSGQLKALSAPYTAPGPLAITAPEEKVFEEPTPMSVDISSIVSERLNAVRKLQENPNDHLAKEILTQAQQKASQWAQSKHLPGQFLGSTGANIMSQEELMGNKKKQAWIKKDVFTSAAPVTSGIGMFLLQKMGWRMGEGLGKNNEGQREPLMLDFKVDRKGLVTTGEGKKGATVPKVPKAPIARDLSGKHPVSALGEVCNKRKYGAPKYELIHESGPSHRKDFVFKVQVNGYYYQPSVSSNNKKVAKAAAATLCLQELGLVPKDM